MIAVQILAACLAGIICGLVIARLLGLKLNPFATIDEALALEKKLAVEKAPDYMPSRTGKYTPITARGMMANVACIVTGVSMSNNGFSSKVRFD